MSFLTFNEQRGRARLDRGFVLATELAEVLVLESGLDFRQAHRLVGHLVRRHLAGGDPNQLTLDELAAAAVEVLGLRVEISAAALRVPWILGPSSRHGQCPGVRRRRPWMQRLPNASGPWQRPMRGPASITVGSEWQRTRCYERPTSARGDRRLRVRLEAFKPDRAFAVDDTSLHQRTWGMGSREFQIRSQQVIL